MARPVVGKPAARLAQGAADLQDVLGSLQDAAVTEAWLRRHARRAPAGVALVAGQLLAASRAEAETARQTWGDAWKAFDSPKLVGWCSR